jgi:hypothetical protein
MAGVTVTFITYGPVWYSESPISVDAYGLHDVGDGTSTSWCLKPAKKLNCSTSPTRAVTIDGRKNWRGRASDHAPANAYRTRWLTLTTEPSVML